MANPLDDFKSSTVTTNEFRVPPIPELEGLVKEYGLMAGIPKWEQQMEAWRQRLEKAINERLAPKEPPVSTSGL